ncbi:GyrI-like domain-containing protein [Cellulomonas edaphi]|uniref:GyrI-like domain-containing protein n=1 Tax=Cellulomonas edaphi TaxID=3053468 RepID=A0ABT7S9Z2_9CELL|nr:GyrI-like domain-containing protein [Cellulomons edaphi]MDM7832344.1 GyrI-like domain-containing protein [Cellulomons edaphi]
MKIDFKVSLDSYRARAGELRLVDVPRLEYLMLDGHGDPNTAPAYAEAIAALYPLAYAVKLASKRDLGRDYVVPPLEALWSAADMEAFTSRRDKSAWDWTLMLMVPDWISSELIGAAAASVAHRVGPVLEQVRLESLDEGTSVQTLHIGPYDAEAEVLTQIHDRFVPEHGLRLTGRHHEIYLSDARRVAPARLRTILRQPVERVQPS